MLDDIREQQVATVVMVHMKIISTEAKFPFFVEETSSLHYVNIWPELWWSVSTLSHMLYARIRVSRSHGYWCSLHSPHLSLGVPILWVAVRTDYLNVLPSHPVFSLMFLSSLSSSFCGGKRIYEFLFLHLQAWVGWFGPHRQMKK